MKIYIAGRITGDPTYRVKFFQAAKAVEELGHVPLTPSILPNGLTQADYMRICLSMIESADLVLFLPDYVESQGAMVEWSYCRKTEKPCDTYTEWMKREEKPCK